MERKSPQPSARNDGSSDTRSSASGSDTRRRTPFGRSDRGRSSRCRVLSLDAPSRAQVGENVGVVVTVRNDGNSPGSYTDALVVADGPVSFEVTFTVHDIAPGEVREVVVGTTIDAVGDVLLGLEKTGVTTRVVVGGGFPGRRALPETED